MQLSSLISGLLPKSLVDIFINKTEFSRDCKVKTLNEKNIADLAFLLKSFKFDYVGLDKLDYGIITCGGINTKEINPSTMESKLINNLYFAGEIIDVDSLTGGYNLQITFSTAYLAGVSICAKNI